MNDKKEIKSEILYIEEFEEITKNMTLREKCDFIINEIRLINYKPGYMKWAVKSMNAKKEI